MQIIQVFIVVIKEKYVFLQKNRIMSKEINRLKVVLAEKKKTNRWLAYKLGKDESSVSKWCTNTSQPDMETLARISILLEVRVEDLYNKQFMESV